MGCENCGIELPNKTTRQRFCSVKCKKILYRKNILTIEDIYQCKYCSKQFKPKAIERTVYCSRECYFEDKKANAKGKDAYIGKPPNNLFCVVCGDAFKSSQSKAKYCSVECRRKSQSEQAYARDTAKPRKCGWCNNMFIPKHKASTSAYCCIEHKLLAIRKARKVRKYLIRKSKRELIYKRDGFTCKLCGKKMRMDKQVTLGTNKPHPLAPTIDHIIPQSIAEKMGWDKKDINATKNLQAAHFKCNSSKGNRGCGEQLLLFGE